MAQSEFRTSGDGFASGAICTDTNLYKCTDNKMEYIEHIAAGTPFPKFPGGNSKGSAVWFPVTLATDGDRTKFDADKTRS